MTVIGYTRDWTTEFFDNRMNVVGSTIVENSIQTVTVNEQPQWSQVVDQIKNKIQDVSFKSLF